MSLENLHSERSVMGCATEIIHMRPDQHLYPKTFTFLKAQITILVSIRESIKIQNKDSDKTLIFFRNVLTAVLDAKYSSLFDKANNTLNEIEEILKKDLPKEVDIIGYRIIKALTSLLRVKSLLSVSMPTIHKKLDNKNHEKNKDENCCMCRLCENYFPLDQIEHHMVNCATAFQSQNYAISLDEKIKELIYTAKSSVLDKHWPCDQTTAQGLLFPVLHCTILLERLLEVNTDSYYNFDSIQNIYDGLDSLKITIPCEDTARNILVRAVMYCREKLKAYNTIKSVYLSEGCSPKSVNLTDFAFIKQISKGAYAKVFIARKISTGDIFAIKVISRKHATRKNTAFTEKNILAKFQSEHVVTLYYTLCGYNNLYIVMEYVPGGDLKTVLSHIGCMDEFNAKFYIVQIVAALSELRSNGIVHRDLKPDNILIDVDGKLKLADFGLSFCGVVEKTLEFAGTPDYVAPEIVLNKGHSFPADYWSLGVIIYELLTGVPPFHRDTPEETFMNICEGRIGEIEASREAIDLISQLLRPNPVERLGYGGVEEIMHHPFFNGIDWNSLDNLKPPFCPVLKSDEDTTYFGKCVLKDYADIQFDLENNRSRAISFGPEVLDSLVNELMVTHDDDDLNLFPITSMSGLMERTAKNAKLRRKHTHSSLDCALKNPITPNIPVPRPTQAMATQIQINVDAVKKRRFSSSRTPEPYSGRQSPSQLVIQPNMI